MSTPETMHAIRITRHGGLEALERAEVAVPVPAEGEVLVHVMAVALNNTDLWTREGSYGRPGDPDALSGWRGPIGFPRIQGADVAGRVTAAGARKDEALIGRRVVVDPAIYDAGGPDANPVGLMGSERDGGYAEYVLAPVERVHDVTGSPLTDDQLAALPTAYGTALGMIERGRLEAGQTVLVSGASGGVGLAAVQLARARGARVLAVSSAAKQDAVREAGAHIVLDRARDLPAQIRAAAPDGIDVALDVVAGDLVSQGLPLLREGGRWVVAGALGGHGVRFDVRRLYLHNAQLIGSSMHTPAHFDLLMDLARRAEIQPVIAAAYPLGQAAAAQRELALRRHVGKIVLHPPAPGSRAPAA
ncbi:NADPH:quinone reductase-like Zn-dependent oxidoreductase [Nonomuraea fuscirosea]|uniref:NADPH:quinone reductase-like Zn-dependent oxidoreductase n=1 Tax=Nonomuraea fuscirosea TaxID=1291556 RepID=A0A2T0MMK8_9ACTN|nr:zinc-binding dehydrogenase [Nonomuraea fuscirosea]PRX59078.1 NADPH:quinone reductase-like Zn-dependent oxidoreductase [Nonomuraea fuscirosea]